MSEKMKTLISCSITLAKISCHLSDKVEKYGVARQVTDDNIIERMRIACWLPKATKTHSEYVIITAFPNQKLLQERTSMLLSKYIRCFFKMFISPENGLRPKLLATM